MATVGEGVAPACTVSRCWRQAGAAATLCQPPGSPADSNLRGMNSGMSVRAACGFLRGLGVLWESPSRKAGEGLVVLARQLSEWGRVPWAAGRPVLGGCSAALGSLLPPCPRPRNAPRLPHVSPELQSATGPSVGTARCTGTRQGHEGGSVHFLGPHGPRTASAHQLFPWVSEASPGLAGLVLMGKSQHAGTMGGSRCWQLRVGLSPFPSGHGRVTQEALSLFSAVTAEALLQEGLSSSATWWA